jgi:hypothetical protein
MLRRAVLEAARMSLATRKEVTRQALSKEVRDTPSPQRITCVSSPYSYYDELSNTKFQYSLRSMKINDAVPWYSNALRERDASRSLGAILKEMLT